VISARDVRGLVIERVDVRKWAPFHLLLVINLVPYLVATGVAAWRLAKTALIGITKAQKRAAPGLEARLNGVKRRARSQPND